MVIWKLKLNHTYLYSGIYFPKMWGVQKFEQSRFIAITNYHGDMGKLLYLSGY